MSEKVQAVILAGGQGTRLRPLTNTRPKPLLPVLGRPCVEYVLRALGDAGVGGVFLTCGYRSQDMVEALGDGRELGVDLQFAFEEKPAGTAGAVKLLEDRIDGTFVVASGDVLADVDIKALVELHQKNHALATMALSRVDRPEEFGIVGLDDDGRIVRFKEKPKTEEVFSNLINAGIYVLEESVIPDIPAGEMYDFSKQLFPKLLARGERLFGAPLSGLWKDIGRPRDLLDANIRMAERRGKTLFKEGAVCSGRIAGEDFRAEGCEIRGPAYIGPRAVIRKDAVLSSCAVGGAVNVGPRAIVSDSFVMDRCVLGEGCRIEGSLLGEGCVVGPGVSLTNTVLGDGVRLEGPASLKDQTVE